MKSVSRVSRLRSCLSPLASRPLVFGGVVLSGVLSFVGCRKSETLPPGDVCLTETRLMTAADSGKVFRGAADGSTRIVGGRAVTGWTDRGNGVWGAKLPKGADGQPVFTETLFVNGRRASRARYPDTGYFHVTGTTQDVWAASFTTNRIRLALPPEAAAKVKAVPADELPWAQAIVHINWDVARYPIESLSDEAVAKPGGDGVDTLHNGRDGVPSPSAVATNGSVGGGTPTLPHGMPVLYAWPMKGWNTWKPKDLYAFENLRSAFDAPGEWFYDAKAGEVLYRPLAGETIREAVVPIDGLETLVAIEGAKDVTFENVTFAFSSPTVKKGPTRLKPFQAAAVVSTAAVTVDRSTNIVFRNCRFEHLGSYALWFREGVRGGGAYACEMTDLGAGGVRMGMPRRLYANKLGQFKQTPECNPVAYVETAPWMTSHIAVEDCLIAHGGRFHPAGVGVLLTHASDSTIVHNDIFDLYYTGVSLGWVWGYAGSPSQRNTVAFNHIYDIGQAELADMGGIYTLGTSFGTSISNNVIHGIHSYSYGGWGLYNDEGSEGIVLENNLVYETDDASYHQHYGRDNVLRNNILLDSEAGQVAVSRAEPHRSLTVERNVILWTQGDAFVKYDGTKHEDAKIDWKNNVWWRTDGKDVFNGTPFSAWAKRVKDEGSVFADPGFTDWLKREITLKAGSPALKAGFKPFDPSLAGRRKAAK